MMGWQEGVVNKGSSEATVDGIRLVGDVPPDAAEVTETRLVSGALSCR
jgi:hypothetical protein